MQNLKNEFGWELRRLRREARYTQAELGKKADNITASYVSQLETGKKIPTPRVIRSLSGALDVLPNYLLSIIGVLEMDLASTLVNNRDQVGTIMPDLPEEQLEEIANYLTYLEFKASALNSSAGAAFELVTRSPVMQILFKPQHRKKAKQRRIHNTD